jgi:Ca2+-binding EF-hand superfamily protein
MNRLKKNSAKQPKKTSTQLIGVGLDQIDGHKRITTAEHFSIVGGSQETHERMTETVVKAFETLDRKGKNLDQVDAHELKDIIKDSTPS